MKLLFLVIIFTTINVLFPTGYVQAQRDILRNNLSEYGTKMTYKEAWVNDDYIILLVKGTMKKKYGHVFLVVHPDEGIVASHIIEREAMHPYNDILYTDPETLVVFYRLLENGKRNNYSLTFSKSTREISIQPIGDELERIEKESIFSFMNAGSQLFASITKDKTKIGFRQMTKEGIARTAHIFDINDTLWRFINPNKSSFSKQVLSTKGYFYKNSARIIGFEERKKEFTAYVFDFNLATETITTRSFSQPDLYNSYAMSFAEDNIFLLKLASGTTEMPDYKMDIDVLAYPTFKPIKSFTTSLSSLAIPYKTSKVIRISYKTGLYFSGQNRKFSEPVEENTSTMKLLYSMSRGNPFISVQPGADNTIRLTLGSREDQLVTNTTVTTMYYFFGCLNYDLNPCSGNTKSASEKIINYLETIRDEKPEFLEFGHKRKFAVFNLNNKEEVSLLEF